MVWAAHAVQAHQLHDRVARARQDHLLAGLGSFHQLRQRGLGLMNVHFAHDSVVCSRSS